MDTPFRGLAFVAAFVVLIVGTQGCDSVGSNFLDKPPSTDVTQDTIFANPNSAQEFLWNAYSTLPYGLTTQWGGTSDELRHDLLASITDINQTYMSWGGVYYTYYPGQYTAATENGGGPTKYYYNGENWLGIRRAYLFIQNIDRTPEISEARKEEMKAEAKMIIAVHYTDMFRNFGGVPWVNHAYGPNEEIGQMPRLTARATLDSTVALIDEASEHLPFARDNSDTGRFTRAGAMGLKARILLFAASPLFNSSQPYMSGEAATQELVWMGGYDQSLWQRAADAAKALIDEAEQAGDYELLDTGNPRLDFRNAYFDRESPELLISTRHIYQAWNWSWNYYVYEVINYGIGATTHNYVNMFPTADGSQIEDEEAFYSTGNAPYENRDPRLYETVVINGDEFRGRTAETYIGGRERPDRGGGAYGSGYRMRKFVLDNSENDGRRVQWPYLRLPEIYLSYAEALNELNGGPTAEAYEYVNRVRSRVDLGDLERGLSQEEFREAVLRERVLEFGYEKVRWFDMVRWKMEDVFTKTLYGMDIYANDDDSFSYEKFELPSRYWQENWSPKWYLSAFPTNEVNLDYGLVQNPGW